MNGYRPTKSLRLFTQERYDAQLALEDALIDGGKARYYSRLKDKAAINTSPGLSLLSRNIELVTEAIHNRRKEQEANTSKVKQGWYRLTKDIDVDLMAYHALAGGLNAASKATNRVTASLTVGEAVCHNLRMDALQAQEGTRFVNQNEKFARKHPRDDVRKRKMDSIAADHGIPGPDWSDEDKIKVGAFLLGEVEGATGLIESYKAYKPGSGRPTMKVVFSTEAEIVWEDAHKVLSEMLPVSLPMLVPPRPWSNNTDGGLLVEHPNVTLINERKVTNPVGIASLTIENCPKVFAAVNAAQDTAFAVNEQVRDVMQECLRTADAMVPSKKGIPKVTAIMPKDLNEKSDAGTLTTDEQKEFDTICQMRGLQYSAKSKAETDWACFRNSLKQAWVQDDEPFWFSAALDGRGRLYYRSARLNPQGNGADKGLLRFAESKRLGSEGVAWLKVHIANSFGADKLSFEDRIQWVEDNHDEIVRCATDPMNPDTLWRTLKTKTRWVALAAAFEYVAMLAHGEDFESNLPLGLDGNCNGLQHLSAMILDPETAFKVSVLPGDKPEDIYKEVRDAVEVALANPSTEAGSNASSVWSGQVTRDICKRPTMTLPYALSDRGRNKQIAEETADMFTDETRWPNALSLSPVVLECQTELIGRPMHLLAYLKRLCDIVITSGNDFEWHTPETNFHAVLRYYASNDKLERTFWWNGSLMRSRRVRTDYNKRDKAGAKRAVAASVTHSMDAAHLHLAVTDLWEQGIDDFYLCHDSIGVHAADAGMLHDALQRTFVNLYDRNFIEELEAQAIKTVVGTKMEGKIENDLALQAHKTACFDGDTFDITDVLVSDYLFS